MVMYINIAGMVIFKNVRHGTYPNVCGMYKPV